MRDNYQPARGDLAFLGVEYIGLQERGEGKFPLEMFTDLSTGTSFLRCPMETVEQALARIRAAYKK
jgi:hypothetical protein